MYLIQINVKKEFNPVLDCTRGSDTTVGTEGIKSKCSGKTKFSIPPGIQIQCPKPGGRVKQNLLDVVES